MALEGLLWCVGTLLGASVAAVAMVRRPAATTLVYAIALGASTIALAIAIGLLGGIFPASAAARMRPVDALRKA